MKNVSTPALLAAAAVTLLPVAGQAAPITNGTYFELGSDVDNTFTGATSAGATITYADQTDRTDVGIASSFSGVQFQNVGDKLTYSYQISGISNSVNFSNTVRSGFDFGTGMSPVLSIRTGYGTQSDLRFGLTTNGNPFSGGTQVGTTIGDWADFDLQNIRFDDDHVIDVVLSLTVTAVNGGGSFDYDFDVAYQSALDPGDFNSTTQSFTGIVGDTPTSVFHLTNSAGVQVAGDTWTIGNASLDFTPIPEPGSLSLLAVGAGLIFARRRD